MTGGSVSERAAELKPIRIFVCSSGDMIAERQAALRVIEAVNRAAHGAARLEPYLWEEHAQHFQGARSWQGNIPLPAEFDIFLGFLFSRVGSRLTTEEYRRDIVAKLAKFPAEAARDESVTLDLIALTQLTAELPADALPTGTTFEIVDARDAAQRPGGDGRPCLWLAVNDAIPDGLTSRDRTIADPIRQRWYEVSQFVAEELNARHVPIANYGAGAPRAQQLKPGGLQGFEDKLEAWLAHTLATRFAVRLSWAERAYVGLRPFTPEEAPILLGRRASIGEALGQLDQMARQGKPTLLLLSGPSGAGKSSFARAGLIGNLVAYRLHRRRAEGSLFVEELVRNWRHLAVRPAELGDDPAGEMLARLGTLLGNAEALGSLASDLAALPFSDAADIAPLALAERLRAEVQRRLAELGPAPGLFLLLDQFEDLLAADRTAATRRLLALLRALAECTERNIWVVVAIADQWRSTLGSAGLVAALEGAERFALPPPRLGELREIIDVPARRAGLAFETELDRTLDQVILDDLQKLSLHVEAPLPLLQVALAQLEDRKEGGVVTFAAYRAMGGVVGAIRAHAQAALGEWNTELHRPVLDRLLFRLVQRDPQQRIVCRLAQRGELESDVEVRALAERLLAPEWRLLQGQDAPGTTGVLRIAHDVLLDQAEAFRTFVENERTNVLLLADARDATARWKGEGEPAALLNHHLPSVERLQALLARLEVPADDDTAAFVAASRREIGRLEQERDSALLTRSRFLAELARQRNDISDFGAALAICLEAIPDPTETIGRVVASEGVVELDRATRAIRERHVLRGHKGPVGSAVFDPTGERLLTISDDKTARLWDVASGTELVVLLGHEGGINTGVFDFSGARVLTASNDSTARIWDAKTGLESAVLRGHESWIKTATFDPPGARALTASLDSTVRVWNAANGAEIVVLRGHDGIVECAAFDPFGNRVLSTDDRGIARIWDAATGAELLTLGRPAGYWIGSAAFDPAGDRVLTVSSSHDNTACIWDAASGRKMVELRHKEWVHSAKFDPSGKRVVTASKDGIAHIWDAESGNNLMMLRGHDGIVRSAEFDQSGKRVLTMSDDHKARIWDSASGTVLAVLCGHGLAIASATFSKTGELVVTASLDGTARTWDITGVPDVAVLVGHEGRIETATFDQSGQQVLTASRDKTARVWALPNVLELAASLGHEEPIGSAPYDPTVGFDPTVGHKVIALEDRTSRTWDLTRMTKVTILRSDRGTSSAAFDSSGTRVLTVSEDNTALVWDAASGATLSELIGHHWWLRNAIFDPSGKRALTASWDRTARIWDIASGGELVALCGHSGEIASAAFNTTGDFVVTASWDDTARIWDAASGAQLAILSGHSAYVETAVFDPSDQRILTASLDSTARIWDAKDGTQLRVLRGHEGGVHRAEFDRSGERVVTASEDHTVRIWDAASGIELAVLRGHEDKVNSAVFDPSGQCVLTASRDATARIWDARSGTELRVLRGHRGDVTSAVFDPSGPRVLTASYDGTARIWRVFPTVAALVAHARAIMPRPLTPEQRKQFFLE